MVIAHNIFPQVIRNHLGIFRMLGYRVFFLTLSNIKKKIVKIRGDGLMATNDVINGQVETNFKE